MATQPYYDSRVWQDPNGDPIYRPIACFDFDGVIHEFIGQWTTADQVSDGPVPGAIEALYEYDKYFDIYVFSSRSNLPGGIGAMSAAIREWDIEYHGLLSSRLEKCPDYFVSQKIVFPTYKPPWHISFDDNCVRFEGVFPDPKKMLELRAWNK